MITSETLNYSETKEHLILNQQQPTPNPVMRDPATCHGFRSLEQANEVLKEQPRVRVWSNHHPWKEVKNPVFFFSGGFDNWKLLESRGFSGCDHGLGRVAPRPSLPDGFMRNAQDIVTVFYANVRHLDTEQELLDYLNGKH
jgi:hypothetical protein